MIEQMTNLYSLSKTLQFSLIPIGETEKYFNERIFEEDLERDKNYPVIKKLMDRYHKEFIERSLNSITPDMLDINRYVEVYRKSTKTEEDQAEMKALEAEYRKIIANVFKAQKEYKSILKPGDFVKELLKDYAKDQSEQEAWDMFRDFTTYFVGFAQNRENMYSSEDQTTGIAHRCINDNLPKFIDNIKVFETKILPNLDMHNIAELDENLAQFSSFETKDHFCNSYFVYTLSQSGIEEYNRMIGGYTTENNVKVKGLNEYINKHNQDLSALPKEEQRARRIPLLKPLFKQILSERDTVSFIPEKFESDQAVLDAINTMYTQPNEDGKTVADAVVELDEIFGRIKEYELKGVLYSAGPALSMLSQKVYGKWDYIEQKWAEEYDKSHPNKAHNEKYYEQRKKQFKSIERLSIQDLFDLAEDELIVEWIKTESARLKENVAQAYEQARSILTEEYKAERKLQNNYAVIETLKTFLDSLKEIERFANAFKATGADGNIDEHFYGKFESIIEVLNPIDRLYDKVRNYVTSKPYSKDKIKLNFKNPQLLGGWSQSKEKDYLGVLLRKNEEYYLAIMDSKTGRKTFEKAGTVDEGDCFEKLNYSLLPGANKTLPHVFFSKKNIDYYAPSQEILEIRKNETFTKGKNFSLSDCHKFIDFYKQSIEKHPEWSKFGFSFSPTSSYENIGAFYREVEEQGFKMSFSKYSEEYVMDAVASGRLYLFKIYSKDFSPNSKGTPNLHTIYFKNLFSEENIKDTVYRLNGEAEMFYRKASISEKDTITHPANEPLNNKNPLNVKKTSVFEYDLIKDRRFTKRQFSLHLPLTLNFHAKRETRINSKIRSLIRANETPYVIGIDRGERNLIYISVIDKFGTIVEQKSLNEICSSYESHGEMVDCKTNYQVLLERKEAERLKSRQEWSEIKNIKELKEGYISQVISEICKLVIKYDAIIALEDLNGGFKNSRKKVERQVYDKFETMLYTKLRYLVDKKLPADAMGGARQAYQLTAQEHKPNMHQDGIIFYVPAWLTSKIDPTTGFVNMLYPKYTSVAEAKKFLSRFTNIEYVEAENLFAFSFDYRNFDGTECDYKNEWTIYSYGERIVNYRDKDKNSEWTYKKVDLTRELKQLFDKNGIDYHANLKEQILAQDEKNKVFYETLIHSVKLLLQMRNSVPNSTLPEDDYIVSPVKNGKGEFYDSRNNRPEYPMDADANGAFHIAKKGLWVIEQLKKSDEAVLDSANTRISKADWLRYCQESV